MEMSRYVDIESLGVDLPFRHVADVESAGLLGIHPRHALSFHRSQLLGDEQAGERLSRTSLSIHCQLHKLAFRNRLAETLRHRHAPLVVPIVPLVWTGRW
jgi:hypothetical protein